MVQDFRPPEEREWENPLGSIKQGDLIYSRLKSVKDAHQKELYIQQKGDSEGYDSWLESFGESLIYETIPGDFARWVTHAWMENDPNFEVTPFMLNELAPDLKGDHHEFMNAKSSPELISRIDTAREIYEHRYKLSQTDGGTVAMIAAGIVDPAFLLTAWATGGAASTVGWTGKLRTLGLGKIDPTKLGRMSRRQGMVRGGLIAGTADGLLETGRAAMSDVWGLEDVPFALAMSVGAGGLIGSRWPQITVSRRYADDYTQELFESRWAALMETSEGTSEELAREAWNYAQRAGRLGYGRLGGKRYHNDPFAVANSMLSREVDSAVAGGLVQRTTRGEQLLPSEKPKPLTPRQYAERLGELRGEEAGIQANLDRAVSDITSRLDGMSPAQVKQTARQVGIVVEGKKVDQIKEELIDELGSTARSTYDDQLSGVTRDINDTRAHWAADDHARYADQRSREWSGEDLDSMIAKTDTYTTDGEGRNIVQFMVDVVNGAKGVGTEAGRLLNHPSQILRRFGTLIADDGLVRNKFSLMREADRAWKNNMTAFRHTMAPFRKQLIREMGLTGRNKQAQANRIILNAVRTGEVHDGTLGDAVSVWRSVIDKERKFAKEFGLGDAAFDPSYVPREFNRVAMLQMKDSDPDLLHRVVKDSFRKGSKITDEDTLDLVAERFIEAGTDASYTTGRMTNTKAFQALQAKLKKELVDSGKMDDEVFDEFMDIIAPIRNRKSLTRSSKSRLNFDETHVDDETGLAFSDLLNNNMEDIYQKLVKRNRGAGYWIKAVDDLAEEGEAGPASYSLPDVTAWIKAKVKKEGHTFSDADEEHISHHFRSMMGMAMGDNAFINKGSRVAMDYAHHVYMNDAGWASSAEFLNAIVLNKLTAIESLFGVLGNSVRRPIEAALFGGARFRNPALDELEAAMGGFSGLYNRVVQHRLDDSMDYMGAAAQAGRGMDPRKAGGRAKWGVWGEKVNTFLRMGTHLNPFGIGPVDHITRMASLESSYQRFINTIYKIDKKGGVGVFKDGHTWWAKDRLNELGLSDEDITKIMGILKTPGIVQSKTNYRFKTKYLAPNFDDWGDEALVQRFAMALNRELDRNIQRTSVSMLQGWANNPVGRLIIQFRTFALGAMSQQLGYNLRRGDVHAIAILTMSLLPRMLTYYLQGLTKTVGMDEEEGKEYMDKRMTPERIAAMGVAGSGPWGLFGGPMDWAGPLIVPDYPREGLFQYGAANTGIISGVVEGVPTYGLIKAWEEMGGEMYDAIAERSTDGITQQTLKKAKSVLPWQNMFGPGNFIDWGIRNSGLPER